MAVHKWLHFSLFLLYFPTFPQCSFITLQTEKMLLRNWFKSKYLHQGYKPKIWVSCEECVYCYIAISQWVIKYLSDFPLCLGPLYSRVIILHKDIYIGWNLASNVWFWIVLEIAVAKFSSATQLCLTLC